MGKQIAIFALIIFLVGIPGFSQEFEDAETAAIDNSIIPDWVLDVNPLMWILSGIADGNNNRSFYFDFGIQYNITDIIALKFNPAVSFGLTPETAFSESQVWFLEVQIPIGLLCFPIVDAPVFFALSFTPGVYSTFDDDNTATFVSIGALFEIGYQLKMTNHLVFTPSVGVASIYPMPMQDGAYASPHYTLYSPWPLDTVVSPRFRLALGFWL